MKKLYAGKNAHQYKYTGLASQDRSPMDVFRPTEVNKSIYEAEHRAPAQEKQPIQQSELPHNFFYPRGSTSIDLRREGIVIQPSQRIILLEFPVPQGHNAFFFDYSLVSTGNKGDQVFLPTVAGTNSRRGTRVLKYHGDPSNNFVIDFVLNVSLQQDTLIPMQLMVGPTKIFRIEVINQSQNNLTVGARVRGYVDGGGTDLKTQETVIG